MTDPIDTALMPCPFCGGDAQRITIGDDEPANAGGDVICCTICQASSHVEFGRKENLVALWNTRAASQADTARAEGIALGLAMAAARCDAIAKDADDEDCLQFDQLIAPHMRGVALDIRALAPIPPHVAAARVLLDALYTTSWHGAVDAAQDVLHADMKSSAWNTDDEVLSAIHAALEQIAKEGE